jgi:NADPH2:quinone reductase
MRLVQFDRPGGLEVIRVVEAPVPEADPGQVRVKVTACGLNFSDTMIRQGRYVADVPFPHRVVENFPVWWTPWETVFGT